MTPIRALFACLAFSLAAPAALAQDAPAKKPAAPAKAAKSEARQPDKSTIGQGRDWTLIDTNKDHFISPDEMEVWLKANPATPAK